MSHKLNALHLQLKSLVIFNRLLNQPILIRLQHLLSKSQDDVALDTMTAYASFTNFIFEAGGNLSEIIFTLVMEDENAYILRYAKKEEVAYMEAALQRELLILQNVATLQSTDFSHLISDDLMTNWEVSDYDFCASYKKRLSMIHKHGYGIYAKYHMFSVKEGTIHPIRYPDMQKLSDFSDYERERNLIIKNTQALLDGNSASNVLLYGDAGTGKSSTIKAIVNAFKGEGLRLVEIKKHQLYQIPTILEQLSNNPLKFILFIDDLSFVSNDENFAALKSILEGGVSAIGNNIVIYATSNRRHLVKEDHQSRQGDEVHLNDTLQETMSLSSRFGLTITFNRPEKDVYLNIVSALAKQYGVEMEKDVLFQKAESFAIRHHGRSPRSAKQFIELLKAGI